MRLHAVARRPSLVIIGNICQYYSCCAYTDCTQDDTDQIMRISEVLRLDTAAEVSIYSTVMSLN